MGNSPIQFQKPVGRSHIFASFVMTLDGKIIVKEKGYWPIGSRHDYDFFTHLRAHADIIIDGKNTAQMFGKKTIETMHSELFIAKRKELGKTKPLEYLVVTSNPDANIIECLNNSYGYTPYIATPQSAPVASSFDTSHIVRIGEESERQVDLVKLIFELGRRGYEHIFVDGGPTLLAGLLEKALFDDLFLTISPKIFGTSVGKTLTLVEGMLFPPDRIPTFTLVSTNVVGNEVILHYKNNL